MKHDLPSFGGQRSELDGTADAWPDEIAKLAPRMRQIAEIVYGSGAVTLREIHQSIDDEITIYGIRTLLGRMVRRGLIRRRPSGRHAEVMYLPAILTPRVRAAALNRMIRREFDGSAQTALIAAMRLAQNSGRGRS